MKKITNYQENMLIKATEAITLDYRDAFLKQLIALIEKNDWLFEMVFKAVSKGLQFNEKTISRPALYNFETHIISFHPSVLPFLKQPEQKYIIDSLLRHELTHAFDFDKINNQEGKSVAQAGLSYLLIIDKLSAQLDCIRSSARVNTKLLSNLAILFSHTPSQIGNLFYTFAQTEEINNYHTIINNYGSIPDASWPVSSKKI